MIIFFSHSISLFVFLNFGIFIFISNIVHFVFFMMSFIREDISTPLGVGRGRGVLCSPRSLQFETPAHGRGMVMGNSDVTPGLPTAGRGVAPPSSRPMGISHESQHTSSTVHDSNALANEIASQMGDVIQQVSQKVVQNVMTRLSPLASTPLTNTDVSTSNMLDTSHVQLVAHRKLKDPPCFKGDGSDLVSVREWEDLMRTFIKRGNLRPEEQADEILVHLRGKARDVVRFGTRNSDVDITHNPEAIYGLLRKHFDCVPCTLLPLADFYTTLPERGESAFDYWLRLHRAVDLAIERLKEQGKSLEIPGTEVTRMFIRNCPSAELSMTFRSKTMDKWTAHEVQDILYEFHSTMAPAVSKMTKERVSVNTQHTAISPPAPFTGGEGQQQPQATDSASLERLIGMLEKVLLQRPVQLGPSRQYGPRRPRIEGLHDTPCLVCHDAAHSTFAHCREHKLCFQCHSPNHSRRACPGRMSSAALHQSEN